MICFSLFLFKSKWIEKQKRGFAANNIVVWSLENPDLFISHNAS